MSESGYDKSLMLTLRGRLVALRKPLVMGIINVTPDSFHAGSRAMKAADAVGMARTMLSEGADILDIGGCSTRPGSESVRAEEELRRLERPLEAIREAFPNAVISVDTFRASVARECIERWNVDIINDISGGEDPEMASTVARAGVAYILMHIRGVPADMDSRTDYDDVVADVTRELAFRLDSLRAQGVWNVIVDPGFGFAKTTEQNYALLAHLDRLKILGCPLLVGMSRKRMAREAAQCDASEALIPTVALNSVALMKGASIIRVHDVKEGVQTAKVIEKLWLASE